MGFRNILVVKYNIWQHIKLADVLVFGSNDEWGDALMKIPSGTCNLQRSAHPQHKNYVSQQSV